MRQRISKLLVTGGAGFIGSEFVRQCIRKGYKTVVIDKLTYAGDLNRLKEVQGKFQFYRADICNKRKVALIFKKEKASKYHPLCSGNTCRSKHPRFF